MQRRNHCPIHVFSWILLQPRFTDPPTNSPPTTYPPTQRLPTQRHTELIIIFRRFDNSNIFILQNTRTAGKTYFGKNFTSVYYPRSVLVSIKHMRRSINKSLLLSTYSLFQSHFLRMDLFSSSQCEYHILL